MNMQRPARHLAKCFACANRIVASVATLLFHRVANRVANFVATDAASHHYHLVANPVLTMLLTVLPTEKDLLLWWRYWLVGAASEPLWLPCGW
jgi:hypothetical protein